MESRRGIAGVAGVLALGLATAGCSGDVSAGAESRSVNLGRCFGADCGVKARSLSGGAIEAAPCGAVEGDLEDELRFERISDSQQIIDAVMAPDGSVWALANTAFEYIKLARFSAEGQLLQTRVVADVPDHTSVQAALTLDASGAVTVGIHSSFAENADSELIEELELQRFDTDLEQLAAPRRFRGMASPHLFGGVAGGVWLAGNADANAPHGVVSRLSALEPDWIQTQVPSAGQGVLGVTGLTVAEDGTAAVVASLSPRWNGGPDVMKAGVSTFDAAGNPQWTLELPGVYAGGSPIAIGSNAEGDLFVVGSTESGTGVSVRGLALGGELRFEYQLENQFSRLEVRRDTGHVLVGTGRGLAVIDSEGTSCREFTRSVATAAPGPAEPWRADREYVLDHSGSLTRFRIPE